MELTLIEALSLMKQINENNQDVECFFSKGKFTLQEKYYTYKGGKNGNNRRSTGSEK